MLGSIKEFGVVGPRDDGELGAGEDLLLEAGLEWPGIDCSRKTGS